jgi:hypothetical protein
MIVFIPDFGQTLIFLSSREEDWPGKKIPEKGKVYEKRGDRFVEVIY